MPGRARDVLALSVEWSVRYRVNHSRDANVPDPVMEMGILLAFINLRGINNL